MQSSTNVPSSAYFLMGSFLGILFCSAAFLHSLQPDVAKGNAGYWREMSLFHAKVEEPSSQWGYRPPAFDYEPLGPEFTDEPWWEQFDNNRTIYVENTAGMCNTLRNTAAALTYAWENKVNVKFVFWNKQRWEDLFDFPKLSSSVFPDGAYHASKSSACATVATGGIGNPEKAENFTWTLTPGGDGEIGCIATCCWLPKPFKEKHTWFFRVLRPIPLLQDAMNEFKRANEWDKYMMVGVHVRRSDNAGNLKAALRAANSRKEDRFRFNNTNLDSILPLDNYVKRMNQLVEAHKKKSAFGSRITEEIRFFLATDNSGARDYIVRQFDEGVVQFYVHNMTDKELRKDITGTRLGAIDYFLLASCEALIGSPQSSFSGTATYIRGIPRFDPMFGRNTTTTAALLKAESEAATHAEDSADNSTDHGDASETEDSADNSTDHGDASETEDFAKRSV